MRLESLISRLAFDVKGQWNQLEYKLEVTSGKVDEIKVTLRNVCILVDSRQTAALCGGESRICDSHFDNNNKVTCLCTTPNIDIIALL